MLKTRFHDVIVIWNQLLNRTIAYERAFFVLTWQTFKHWVGPTQIMTVVMLLLLVSLAVAAASVIELDDANFQGIFWHVGFPA